MRNALLKIMIAICVIVGLGSLSRCAAQGDDGPSSSSSSSGSVPDKQVEQIEISDEQLLL